jgi:hypothetical protein
MEMIRGISSKGSSDLDRSKNQKTTGNLPWVPPASYSVRRNNPSDRFWQIAASHIKATTKICALIAQTLDDLVDAENDLDFRSIFDSRALGSLASPGLGWIPVTLRDQLRMMAELASLKKIIVGYRTF